MLELSLIVFGLWALVAFLGGKVGYRMGAKRAAAEIADFFRHEIKSTDNDLKSIPALLARRSMLTDGSLRQIANKLHFAAWNKGMAVAAGFREPKTKESSITMDIGDATDREIQFTRNAANEASVVENRILEAVARPACARLEAKLDAGHHGNWRRHGLARDGLVGCCIAPRAMA